MAELQVEFRPFYYFCLIKVFQMISKKDSFIKIYRFIYNAPWWLLFAIGFAWRLLVNVIVQGIFPLDIVDLGFKHSEFSMFIRGIVLAPIIETLLFQLIPIELLLLGFLNYTKKQYPLLVIIISALLFGLSHYYSIGYIVLTFFIGLYLAALYFVFRRRSNSIGHAYLMTAFFHLLYNLTSFVVSYI